MWYYCDDMVAINTHPKLVSWGLPVLGVAALLICNSNSDTTVKPPPTGIAQIKTIRPGYEESLRISAERDWQIIQSIKTKHPDFYQKWLNFLKKINIDTDKMLNPKEAFIYTESSLKYLNLTEALKAVKEEKLAREVSVHTLLRWFAIEKWLESNPEKAKEILNENPETYGVEDLAHMLQDIVLPKPNEEIFKSYKRPEAVVMADRFNGFYDKYFQAKPDEKPQEIKDFEELLGNIEKSIAMERPASITALHEVRN